MLRAFPAAYCVLESGMRGPSADGQGAEAAVLGGDGVKGLYDQPDDRDRMSWYRYLFLNRGKPGTHLRALSRLTDDQLKSSAPAELISLVEAIAYHVR